MGRQGHVVRVMKTRFGPSAAIASLAVAAVITMMGVSETVGAAPAPATPGSGTDKPGPTTTSESTAPMAGTTTTSSRS
jgi:hypothetical protein